MHGISSTASRPASALAQGSGMNAPGGPSGDDFHLAALTTGPGAIGARGINAGASSRLGAQTVSILLQTQDLDQTPLQTRGHGGGHRGGGMAAMPGALEAEETETGVEAQMTDIRKKLNKLLKGASADKTAEADEKDDVSGQSGKLYRQNNLQRRPATNGVAL